MLPVRRNWLGAAPFTAATVRALCAGFSFKAAPWIDRADMLRKGFIGICAAADRACIDQAHRLAGQGAALQERRFRRHPSCLRICQRARPLYAADRTATWSLKASSNPA